MHLISDNVVILLLCNWASGDFRLPNTVEDFHLLERGDYHYQDGKFINPFCGTYRNNGAFRWLFKIIYSWRNLLFRLKKYYIFRNGYFSPCRLCLLFGKIKVRRKWRKLPNKASGFGNQCKRERICRWRFVMCSSRSYLKEKTATNWIKCKFNMPFSRRVINH